MLQKQPHLAQLLQVVPDEPKPQNEPGPAGVDNERPAELVHDEIRELKLARQQPGPRPFPDGLLQKPEAKLRKALTHVDPLVGCGDAPFNRLVRLRKRLQETREQQHAARPPVPPAGYTPDHAPGSHLQQPPLRGPPPTRRVEQVALLAT